MPRFFSEQSVTENSRVTLDARVAQHVRVLRLRVGDAITLFDGTGGEVPATVIEIGKRDVIVETQARITVECELEFHITLCVGLIANDRFDWLIQKAVELGVAEIQPMYTERSQRIPGDVEKRVSHWRGVVIAACEQCGRNQLPKVNAPVSLDDALKLQRNTATALMDADGEGEITLGKSVDAITILVGPEGGFSPIELEVLRVSCKHRLRIGETILRAETAALAALVKVAM